MLYICYLVILHGWVTGGMGMGMGMGNSGESYSVMLNVGNRIKLRTKISLVGDKRPA